MKGLSATLPSIILPHKISEERATTYHVFGQIGKESCPATGAKRANVELTY